MNIYIYIGFIERGLRLKAVRSKISASGITVAIQEHAGAVGPGPEVGKIGLEQRTSPGDAEELSAAVMRLRCHEFHGRSLGIPRTKRAASKMGRSSNKTADFLLPCLSARRYSL